MSLNPISTTQNIKESYLEYLSSIFFLKNQSLANKVKVKLYQSDGFVKGPYIEITPPFTKGVSMQDLINSSVLSKEFVKLDERFDVNRPLYLHQEKAIRKIVSDQRNIVVATGTGSGKTECFLIPIIDYLMKQKEDKKLGSGVRALLLYPMNALANDQLKRLRDILKEYPDITFGRYTGETLDKKEAALENFKKMNLNQKPLKNELLSREEMKDTPPNILLTNYAMLEYLLLRPDDNVFFDGEYSGDWKFIVLDEAHTYRGSKGTEISMLLQRLKDRVVQGERGKIRCIATSATLGGGKDKYKDVANFATGLFQEPFDETDIVEASRVEIKREILYCTLHQPDFYNKLYDIVNSSSSDEIKLSQLRVLGSSEADAIQEKVNNAEDYREALYYLLKDDRNLVRIQVQLKAKPRLLDEIVGNLFSETGITLDEKRDLLVKLVEVAVKARNNKDDAPLLPARYHVFVRALEGAYVSFWPEDRIYLNRRENFEVSEGKKIPVFELANCQRCGQEYLVGKVNESNQLEQVTSQIDPDTMSYQQLSFFMLSDDIATTDFDEDEEMLIESIAEDKNIEEFDLCCVCGTIQKSIKVRKNTCCETAKILKVKKIKTRENGINFCISCGNHSHNIVKKFLTADAPTTEVLARTLYQNIPDERILVGSLDEVEGNEDVDFESFFEDEDQWGDVEKREETFQEGKSRKLLVFSDNRQEAAFFASYLQLRYDHSLWRHLIIKGLRSLDYLPEYNLDDLMRKLRSCVDDFNLTFEDNSEGAIRREIYSYLLKEFMGIYTEIGLEGLGLIKFIPKMPNKWVVTPYLKEKLNLTKDESWILFCILLDSLRHTGAVTFPDDIAPTDSCFEPRNKKAYFRLENGSYSKEQTVFGWLPKEKSSNKRTDFIKKLLVDQGYSEEDAKIEAREILKFLGKVFVPLIKSRYLIERFISTKEGIAYQLNYTKWNVVDPNKNSIQLYRCDKCGTITHYNLRGICHRYRCQGNLTEYHGEKTRFTYYRDLYENMKPISMKVEEHTAQLTSQRATELQAEFEEGKVNILSCSTTFEMGVDVGQLEAVFMRNVPPETANYVQRAGRAGRRTSSTAFALTFAKRRSHDLTYFQDPVEIIAGKIKTPYVENANGKIIRRHLHSVVFSWFFRKHQEYFGTVDSLFQYKENGESLEVILAKELDNNPSDLYQSIKNVIPQELYDELGITDGSWIKELIGDNEKYQGVLTKAKHGLLETLKEIQLLIDTYTKKDKYTDSLKRMKNTLLGKKGLDFLASRNVLPKYGFPVDLVNLDILHEGKEASLVELSRDLKMAISEFAPGSQVIAGGRIWESYSVNKSTTKGWQTYAYSICPACGKLFNYPADISENINEIMERVVHKCLCGEELKYSKYIIPEFGFSTSIAPPKKPSERNIQKMYSTKVIFDDYDDIIPEDKELSLGQNSIQYSYSPRGKLFLVNQGLHKGFRICSKCGFATFDNDIKKEHRDKLNNKCKNEYLKLVHFGHSFMTDVLQIKVPSYVPNFAEDKKELWLSVLYGLLEGACIALGISRSEINGCLYYDSANLQNPPSFILYDEVPGGAGHVKKISQNLDVVFKSTVKKLSGYCGCGTETSCYGCLRNYGNQFYHEKLKRGLAYSYIQNLLNPNIVSSINEVAVVVEDEVIDELDDFEWIYEYCEINDISTPVIGYELFINGQTLGIAEIAWEVDKIAFFLPEQVESINEFSKNGWKCIDVTSIRTNEIKHVIDSLMKRNDA